MEGQDERREGRKVRGGREVVRTLTVTNSEYIHSPVL